LLKFIADASDKGYDIAEGSIAVMLESIERKQTDNLNQTISKALFRIQERWELKNKDLAAILFVNEATVSRWKKAEEIPLGNKKDIETIRAFLSIYRSLGAMFTDEENKLVWLRSPHEAFGGETPWDFAVKNPAHIYELTNYLNFVRGLGA